MSNTAKSFIVPLLLIPLFAFSHDAVALPGAGFIPESSFYFVDKLGEAVREFFTFNPEKKARLQIVFVAERIAEIKIILETKGVAAAGLDVAQSRLQANIAKAAVLIEGEKSKGRDVRELARSVVDDFGKNTEALRMAFREHKRALKAKEDELKIKIREAQRAGDSVQAELLAQELGEVKAQKELLELKEDEQEEAFEQEEEKIEREMEARESAEEAIEEAEEEKQDVIGEASEEGITAPAGAFGKFDKLLAQAKELFGKENYVGAKQLAEQAEKSLDAAEESLEDLAEDFDEAEEKLEKLQEERDRKKRESREMTEERDEKGTEEESKEEENRDESIVQPARQKPVLQFVADDVWCPRTGPTVIENPLSGTKSAQETLGVETISVGNTACRACHTRSVSVPGGEVLIDGWSDSALWKRQGFRDTWACMKIVSGQSVMEKWPGAGGATCAKQDGIYMNGAADLCE